MLNKLFIGNKWFNYNTSENFGLIYKNKLSEKK